MATALNMRYGRLLAAMSLLMAVAAVSAEHAKGLPPAPVLPQRFKISFYASDTQSSPFENQGTLVTVVRDGNAIGIHYDYAQSSIYYDLRCTSTDQAVSSVQVSWFNSEDPAAGESLNQKQCWYAPQGFQVTEGQWSVVREIINAWASQPASDWEFGGNLRNYDIRMHLWSRMASASSRHEVSYNSETGEPIQMVLTHNDIMHIWQFIANSTVLYNESQTVPLATPPPLDNCVLMQDKMNYGACPTPSQRRAMQAAADGQSDYAPNWRQLDAVLGATITGAQPYTGPGAFKVPYTMVGTTAPPATFFPARNGKDKPDVRHQRNCGSCWAFGTAASLSSIYSNKHGVHYTFAPQYLADCVPKPKATDSGTGCWGSSAQSSLDFLINSGGIMPLEQDYSYMGVQGKCYNDTQGVQLGLSGYALPATLAEAKDAVVNRGAVIASVQSVGDFGAWGEIGKSITMDQMLEGTARGLSCSGDKTDHIVSVIGYTKCKVKNTNFGYSDGECWIVQNSWGSTTGIEGLWLINMDTTDGADCGLGSTMVVPILDGQAA